MERTEQGEIRVRCLILRRVAYKENSAMVTALSPSGLFGFAARGVNKLNSKNLAPTNELSLSSLVFLSSSQGKLTLKEGKLEESLLPENDDLEAFGISSFLLESTLRFLSEDSDSADCEAIFDSLLANLRSLKTGDSAYLAGTRFLSVLLKVAGIAPEVNRCVRCGTRNGIAGISKLDGGFVCLNCLTPSDERKPVAFLKDFRTAILAPEALGEEHIRDLFLFTADFLVLASGVHLKSLDMLKRF